MKKCKFDGQTLVKCDFLEGRLPNFFWWQANYTQSFSSFHCQKLPSSNILKQAHPVVWSVCGTGWGCVVQAEGV